MAEADWALEFAFPTSLHPKRCFPFDSELTRREALDHSWEAEIHRKPVLQVGTSTALFCVRPSWSDSLSSRAVVLLLLELFQQRLAGKLLVTGARTSHVLKLLKFHFVVPDLSKALYVNGGDDFVMAPESQVYATAETARMLRFRIPHTLGAALPLV